MTKKFKASKFQWVGGKGAADASDLGLRAGAKMPTALELKSDKTGRVLHFKLQGHSQRLPGEGGEIVYWTYLASDDTHLMVRIYND